MEPEQSQAARLSAPAFGSLVVLGALTVFAPLIEGGTTHLPVLIIRFILLLLGYSLGPPSALLTCPPLMYHSEC